MAVNCSLAGIYNDIHQQLISEQSSIFQYGVYIGLGTPSVNSSLWPSIIHNETSFRTDDFCTAIDSTIECYSVSSDGVVNTTAPPGFKVDTSYKSLDDSSLYPNVSISHGQDSVNIWTNFFGGNPSTAVALNNVPITLVSNYSTQVDHFLGPGDTIGLGPSSTILESLYSQKLISSRSYGLYVGTTTSGVAGLQNGSLVLGGYDSAGFSGQAYSYEQSAASAATNFSPFKVRVNQMSLQLASGQSVNLMDQSGFDAYLTTEQYPVQFPRSVTQKLANNLNTLPTNSEDKTLRMPSGFSGNLTITLDNGFSVTFNSSWLSTTFGTTPISSAPLKNSSSSDSDSSSTTAAANTPMLGLAFLQQVYLFVSNDESPPAFWLAQANVKTDFFQQEPLCPGTTPQSARSPNINKFIQQGMIGAVIGGVIGGMALAYLIYYLITHILRKRQNAKNGPTEDLEASMKRTGMRGGFARMRQRQANKAVKFRSGDSTVAPTPPPKNAVATTTEERSHSAASDSTTSTKTSASNHRVTTLKGADKVPYTETRELTSLDFGLNPALGWQQQQPRDSRNPYNRNTTIINPNNNNHLTVNNPSQQNRTSSIYSGDNMNYM